MSTRVPDFALPYDALSAATQLAPVDEVLPAPSVIESMDVSPPAHPLEGGPSIEIRNIELGLSDTLTFTTEDGQRFTLSSQKSKAILCNIVGQVILTNEIKVLNPPCTSSKDRISFNAMTQYDINNDPKIQKSTLLHALCSGLTNTDPHAPPTTKENASIANLHALASPHTSHPFKIQTAHFLQNSGASNAAMDNMCKIGFSSSLKVVRRLGIAQDVFKGVDQDLETLLLSYKPGELLFLLLQDNLQWKDGNGG